MLKLHLHHSHFLLQFIDLIAMEHTYSLSVTTSLTTWTSGGRISNSMMRALSNSTSLLFSFFFLIFLGGAGGAGC
jgi:hypothetical protein